MKTVLEDLTKYSRPSRRQEFPGGGGRLALLVTNLTKRGAIAAGDLRVVSARLIKAENFD